ncbi:MAG: aspartate carbamoyltransferase catalytic subunit, partial [Verrucomicrobiota bacterium]
MTELKPRKDLLDIESLSLEEIEHVLENAVPFKQLFQRSVKKVPTLRGKTVLNLFYEPSTRTSSSFEVAANRLSADVTNFTISASSVVKGESLLDTIETLQAMQSDYIVIRHQSAGVPEIVAKHTQASVLNAGDGYHAHPTQALLDAMTFREVYPDYEKRRVVIVGDILHSRVARSTSTLFHKLGIEVGVLGPGSLVPEGRHDFMRRFESWDEVFEWGPHAVYLLRVQLERQEGQFFP